jgi:beta-galactosidase
MKKAVIRLLITALAIAYGSNVSVYGQKSISLVDSRDRLFNSGWKFVRDSLPGAERPGYDDSGWMTIDLPHDYSIMDLPGDDGPDQTGPFSRRSPGNGNSTGHVIGGTGWCRKTFTLDKKDFGKAVILKFDGVYMESQVWVNGKEAGIHKNGYTPFWYDITSLLNSAGKPNLIAVKVDNPGRNSRWYSGSGIYRDVHLIVTNPVHIVPWGVKITTPEVRNDNTIADVEVTTQNKLETRVNAIVIVNIKDSNGKVAASAEQDILIPAGSEKVVSLRLGILKPDLWSVESPRLYSAEITIKSGKKVADLLSQSFGIRSFEFSAKTGFLLNGKTVKLKGGCLHHDNGLLGAAAYARAEERKVETLKAGGFNAVRCAHNPPSEAFLDTCDRLGILVIDEFTDMWEWYKNPQDYSRFFRDWWKRNLTDMILRDRNHPSIIMWSIGNEIHEREDSTRIRICRQLAEHVRNLDNTRAVTQAVTGVFYPDGWESTAPVFEEMDVCGYNYSPEKFEQDHQMYPDRIMYTSESFPKDIFDYWKAVEDLPWVIGDFVWTAFDYLGEVMIANSSLVMESHKSNPMGNFSGFKIPRGMNIFDRQAKMPSQWPFFTAWCGDFDITGEKKPQMLYKDVIWDNSKVEINVHSYIPEGFAENLSSWGWFDELPSWSWKGLEGKPLRVRVFTKASHVRLELNGRIVGEKDLLVSDKYIALFEVPYQPGELKATAYENGNESAVQVLKTAGEPSAIRLTPDRAVIKSGTEDLSFVRIEVIDAAGQVVPEDSIMLNLSVTGSGRLAASGNANPGDMASVNNTQVKTWKGRAQVVIRPSGTGTAIISAESPDLGKEQAVITVGAN